MVKSTFFENNMVTDAKILSDNGYNKVKKIYPITKQKVYRIKTKSGKEIFL